MGLINGKNSPETFLPNDNMTYAEAIKLAACMNQLYNEGTITLKNGTASWYDSYVEYCIDNGIITKEYNYNEKEVSYRTVHSCKLQDSRSAGPRS